MRRIVIQLLFLLMFLAPALSWADERVVIEHISFDEKTMSLTIHADVLDGRGVPVDKLKEEALQILASGEPLKIAENGVDIEQSKDAGEPIAIVVLMNASAGYQMHGEGEVHSTYQQEKEGFSQFVGKMEGSDKVAIYQYRESVPFEQVYDFASNFKQAKEAVLNANVPDSDLDPETLGGGARKKRSLAPEVLRATQKALGYMVDNLDKLGSARRRFLVLMSDGKDRETRKSKLTKKIERILDKYAEYKIRIHAIGFTADDPQYLSILQSLANGSGGLYRRIDSKDFSVIPATIEGIADRIKKQYIIKVTLDELPDWGEPSKQKPEASYNITLKVTGADDSVNEGQMPDVVLPLRGFDWKALLKWIGIVIGGILGIVLLVFIGKSIAGRGGNDEEEVSERPVYDGPDRGKLFLRAGPLAGEVFPLIDDVTTIGSMRGNTIVIEDGSVSRRHAAIKIDQMRYEIADMNSTNGVLVNGARVHKVFLKNGDTITIGTTEIEFRLK
jgi:hypothetical protein